MSAFHIAGMAFSIVSMHQRHLLPVIGLCLLIVAAVLFFGKNQKSSLVPAYPTKQASLSQKPTPASAKENSPPSAAINPEIIESPSPAQLSHEATLEEINEAAVTYDAKALPRIQPYLIHPDPEIREAAKNGMIVLGDAAAGTLLREASRKVATPQEAVALLEAADYVELPSGLTLLNRKTGDGKKPSFGGAKPPVPSEQAPSAPLTR
jgi:hypothetical protein